MSATAVLEPPASREVWQPLVSVITPTWDRDDHLLNRCVPSMLAQTYQNWELVVVYDGPSTGVEHKLPDDPRIRFAELAYHDSKARWGHWARLAGIDLAHGEFIAYLDDDDAFRPNHLEVLVGLLLRNPHAGFAYAKMMSHHSGNVIGTDPPVYCGFGTPMMVHRREILEVATWEQSLPSIDWDLCARWLDANVQYVFADILTVDVWPHGA